MKKLLTLGIGVCFAVACSNKTSEQNIKSFTSTDLLEALEILSHDSLEGRGFSTQGNEKARRFIADQFSNLGIDPAFEDGYIQDFEHTFSGRSRQYMFPMENPGANYENVKDTTLSGANIVALIPGVSEKIIVVTAHFDHLGIRNGEIYNGADDDASGTAALLAIGAYFKKNNPYHTLILAAVDGEEIGSPGCKYLAQHFPGGIENVILDVNMDMIAHNDSSELWACGTYHYPELKAPIANIESKIALHFGHDDPNEETLDDWTRASDHRIFHDRGIPFIYFGVEDHVDYHQSTDVFENINKEFYLQAVSLIIEAIDSYDDHFAPRED